MPLQPSLARLLAIGALATSAACAGAPPPPPAPLQISPASDDAKALTFRLSSAPSRARAEEQHTLEQVESAARAVQAAFVRAEYKITTSNADAADALLELDVSAERTPGVGNDWSIHLILTVKDESGIIAQQAHDYVARGGVSDGDAGAAVVNALTSSKPLAEWATRRRVARSTEQDPNTDGERALEDPSLFAEHRRTISETLPKRASGSASAVRFVSYRRGVFETMRFESEDGFVPVEGSPGASSALMRTPAGERLAVVLSSLKPGHYDCAASGSAIGFLRADDTFISPTTAWSDNDGGACELDLWEGAHPGDVQGWFHGVLATNEGHERSIGDGYFYARAPKATPPSTTAGAPPGPPRPYRR